MAGILVGSSVGASSSAAGIAFEGGRLHQRHVLFFLLWAAHGIAEALDVIVGA